ncbi:MAG: hypothetical protein ABRQ39_12060 [Candidatus Eremiobacterota bacterium]
MKKNMFEFCTVLLVALIITVNFGFYFVTLPKQHEIDALEKGPGGIFELTCQRDADRAYIQRLENYKEELLKTKKELAELKKKNH